MKKWKVTFTVSKYRLPLSCSIRKQIGVYTFFIKCNDQYTAISKAGTQLFKIFHLDSITLDEIDVLCVKG